MPEAHQVLDRLPRAHADSFVYQARAFLDEVAGRDELPRNASFADGRRALLLEEAVVRAATQDVRIPVTA